METKTYSHFSLEEREILCLGLEMGLSLREIATQLGRAPSSMSREVERNRCGTEAPYRAVPAKHLAQARACKLHRVRKLANPRLWSYVRRALQRGWSPEQIAGRLRSLYPQEVNRQVSHETIYPALYVMPRGTLRRELLWDLRQGHQNRRPRSRGKDRRGQIPNVVSIHDRPAAVETHRASGHWEGDLLKGKAAAAVRTLVERRTRLVLLVKLPDSTAPTARQGFARKLSRVPAPLRKSLTYDRGKEMSEHEQLSQAVEIKVYFADPHSPWQRGTCENTNGLLRQYLPKGRDLSAVSQRDLNRIAHLLNTRPRKTLNWATPLETYEQSANVALDS